MDEGVWMNKNGKPLVSIIVPVYNVEKYICQCIDSILNQTYENLEVILVDDGSPDNCGKICDEYAQFDKRVRVIHKENGGLSSARNAGLDAAKGDYIAFIDSDDYIAADMFATMLDIAIKDNADMVKCGFKEFDDKSIITKKVGFDKQEVLENDETGSALMDLYFGSVLYKIACNAIYVRDMAIKVRFPEGLVNEDNYSAGMYLFYAKRIVCINKEFYFYRNNQNGLSKTGRKKRLLDVAILTAKLHEDLIEKGLSSRSFLCKLESKFAREIFHCVKYSKGGVFYIRSMDRKLYSFVLSRLDCRRKLQMQWYKILGRFKLK